MPRSAGVADAEYSGSMDKTWNLHKSMQELQTMHRKRSMVQILAVLSTVIAWDGQRFIQMEHDVHFDGSKTMCPRVAGNCFAGSAGKVVVTGLWKNCFAIVLSIFIAASPLHASDTRINR